MPRPIINGSLIPVLTGRHASYDKSKGLVITEDYETAGDNLGGIALACLSRQVAFELTPNGRKSKLSISSAGSTSSTAFADVTSDTWQIHANELQKGIAEHPQVLLLPAKGQAGSYADVYQRAQDYLQNKDVGDFSGLPQRSLVVYNLLIHEVNSYVSGQYVLHHTTNVSDRYDNNSAQIGVESILTTTQLISHITDPTLWAFPAPGLITSFVQGMQVQIASTYEFAWGWRKLPSQVTTAANNRVDIVTEFSLASWSRLLYRPYGGEFPEFA